MRANSKVTRLSTSFHVLMCLVTSQYVSVNFVGAWIVNDQSFPHLRVSSAQSTLLLLLFKRLNNAIFAIQTRQYFI